MAEMILSGGDKWDPYFPAKEECPIQFVERMLRRQNHPENQLVPETVFWAVANVLVVGRISLRHELKGNLHKIGGHIGYEVRPSCRRKGFATEMLRQVLLTSKAKEIGKLLLTCAPDNVASNKTIKTNGGQLTQKIFVEMVQADRNHYWISLGNQESIR